MINNGMVSECELNDTQIVDEKRRGMVCRDFMRNSCWRGSACRFQHPESPRKLISFCHDFQNGDCKRSNSCRFIHSSVEDENYYKRTGELPPHLLQRISEPQLNWPTEEREPSPVQVCNLKHLPLNEYKRLGLVSKSPPILQVPIDSAEELYPRRRVIFDYEPESKRRRTGLLEDGDIVLRANGFVTMSHHEPVARPYMMMDEENMLLRAKISELKKRVDDLQATNEFLLEQNAQLRLGDKTSTAGLTTVTVPAVTITNTVPGGAQMQQAPTPQQMVNAAIRTVTASVATVPVSIAAVTPVSIAAVSMAPVQPMPPPPVVTMAPQQPINADAPPPEPIIPSLQPPLVSYPLTLSHPRPVIQAADLRPH